MCKVIFYQKGLIRSKEIFPSKIQGLSPKFRGHGQLGPIDFKLLIYLIILYTSLSCNFLRATLFFVGDVTVFTGFSAANVFSVTTDLDITVMDGTLVCVTDGTTTFVTDGTGNRHICLFIIVCLCQHEAQ